MWDDRKRWFSGRKECENSTPLPDSRSAPILKRFFWAPLCSGEFWARLSPADGSRVRVQNLHVGAVMFGYNTTTSQYSTSIIRMVYPVVTTNMLVINTAAGVPIRVEANLRQTLWTKTGWTPAPLMRV